MTEQPGHGTDPAPEKLRSPATALAIGLVAGLFTAFFGIGGGFVTVPALVALLNIRQPRAVGTSLAAMLPAAIAALLAYAGNHSLSLDLWAALELALGSVAGAALGGGLARALRTRRFRPVFGVAIVLGGMVMVYAAGRPAGGIAPAWHSAGAMVGLGALVGLLSGLMSVSASLLIVPALGLILGCPEKLAQALSLAVVVPVSMPGALAHARRGNLIASLGGWMALGGVVGVEVTAWWVQRIHDALLRGAFGALLIAVGVSMVAAPRGVRERANGHA